MPHHPNATQSAKSDEILADLAIDEIAFGGAGLGRLDGKVIFVPFTIDGETVDIRLENVHRSHSFAKLETIRHASPHRVEAPCPYFQNCGGCDYQHIAYDHQLAVKQKQVEKVIQRIAKLVDFKVRPITASPKHFGFRNRISVHTDGDRIGFYQKGSRTVVDIANCLLASEIVNAELRAFRVTRPSAGAHVTLRQDDKVSTFSQTNDDVAQLLLDFVRSRVQGPVVVDGYCGSGFFARSLAGVATKVIGVDWSQQAIRQAQKTAGPLEAYLCGDIGEVLDQILAAEHPDTVIVDPSAKGISDEVVSALTRQTPPHLIYVSCNPPTFARDLLRLSSRFQVQEIQPFDMFPQTAEIEVVGVLKKV